jgi:hypothetical protein
MTVSDDDIEESLSDEKDETERREDPLEDFVAYRWTMREPARRGGCCAIALLIPPALFLAVRYLLA